MSILLEYVWLDGYTTSNLRSKVKVISSQDVSYTEDNNLKFETLPIWNFDGSSTRQAPGDNSECMLAPVRSYKWDQNHYIILCEVMNPDGTPHSTNTRAELIKLKDNSSKAKYWWGFEQEYFITQNLTPLGFPATLGDFPSPQGPYYCGVGGNQVKGRAFVEAHLKKCLQMGIELTGLNAEVAIGQWEYQCFARDTLKACDDLWISRYVLCRMAEEYGWDIDITPKPIKGDWNGSGCHTNFSTDFMRVTGGAKYFDNLLSMMHERHHAHISGYGENNDQRLTGDHETQHITQFSWGVADRGASIRVPTSTGAAWRGYLEDRRPASNCDPYKVTTLIIDTVTMADV